MRFGTKTVTVIGNNMPYKLNKQTGAMDYIDPNTGSILSQTSVQTPNRAQSGRGFLRSAANMLVPRTSKLLRSAKAGLTLSVFTDQEEEDRKRREKLIKQLVAQSRQEGDPSRRSDLLSQARDIAEEGTNKVKSAITKFEEDSGTSISDKERVVAEALGVAGELGTFFIPGGKLLQSAKLTQRILQGAKVGAKVGTLSALTDPEEQTVEERIRRIVSEATVGGLVGGAATAAFTGVLAATKKFLGTNKARGAAIAKLFRVSSSDKTKFRSSTGGRNFEEELLAREAGSMSGKNFEQLRLHFVGRKEEAKTALDNILDGSSRTVNKATMISILKRQHAALSPKKGRVGTEGARRQLQDRIDELSLIPEEEIPLRMANNIKADLQALGDAAFSPSGKATPVSNAMASASGKFKNAIEKVVQGTNEENIVREANFTKQLYDLAARSITRTGDNVANSRANDVVQRLLQQLPTIAALGGGIGVGAFAGPAAGIQTGAIIAALLVGSAKARAALLSPQVQTKLIGRFKSVLTKQGEENADAIANRIVSEMSKLASRQVVTTRGAQTEEIPDEISEQVTPDLPEAVSPTEQLEDRQTVTIRNSETGEVKTVQRDELGKFGLAPDGDSAIPGLPSKAQVLVAMVIDIQKGGKNVSKLNTILDAYDKVGIGKEEELDLTENQKKQLSNLSKSQDIVKRLGEEASSIISPDDSAFAARFKGLSLKALATVGLIPDEELQSKVSAFKKVRKGMRVQIARGLGEVGNLSEPEQKAALDLLPDITMSQGEIDENIRLIEEIIDLAKARVIEFSGGIETLQ